MMEIEILANEYKISEEISMGGKKKAKIKLEHSGNMSRGDLKKF